MTKTAEETVEVEPGKVDFFRIRDKKESQLTPLDH